MSGVTRARTVLPARFDGRWRAEMDDYVIALAWSPDGALLAAASVSGTIRVFDAQAGSVSATLPGHAMGTNALDWHPDSTRLASIGQDGKAIVWDAKMGERLHVLQVGASWGERALWSAKGDLLATAAGKIVRLWNGQGEQVREFTDHASTVTDMAWKPGTDQLAVGAYGGAVIWKADSEQAVRRLTWQGSTLRLCWSRDGSVLTAGQQDSSIIFWDARKPEPSMMWGYATKVRELAWDRFSKYLATGGSETIVIWKFGGKGPEGTKPIQLVGHEDLLTALAFQHKGSVLASSAQDGTVLAWLPGKRDDPLGGLRGLGSVSHVVWSPDDRFLAIGDDQGAVVVAHFAQT
ncbi:MAG: WD40 repeat domain-containing protein [Chloroflexota bacterium]|nr:WD40 repeat domain-containing protein [Chloroflexota bacterium]